MANTTVQVVWVTTKAGNDGYQNLPGALCGEEQNVVEKTASMAALQNWVAQHNFVEHCTELWRDIGVNLTCYAIPHSWDLEHKGQNNVISTYMTCRTASGLAPNTIFGKAVFVKRDMTGKPVDLPKREFLRMRYFINDLMDRYPVESEQELEDLLERAQRQFPSYTIK